MVSSTHEIRRFRRALFVAVVGCLVSIQVLAETIGPPLVDRAFLDTADVGYLFLNTSGFTQSGLVTGWSFFNNEAGTGSRTLEPLLVRQVGSDWVVTGRGAVVTTPAAPPGGQSYSFNLVAGSAVVGPGYSFAHHDLNTMGSIEFDDGVGSFQYYLFGNTSPAIGSVLSAGGFAGARTYSEQFTSTQAYNSTTGSPLVARASQDGATGSIFAQFENPFRGVVTEWGFFDDSSGNTITPLILERQTDASYQVVGVGTPRISNNGGAQTYPFGLVVGTTVLSENRFLGWYDGNNATGGGNTGVIDFDTPTVDQRVAWFGPGYGTSTVGAPLAVNLTLAREYSVQSTQVTVKQVVGRGLEDRTFNDSAAGSIFVLPEQLEGGQLTEWAFYDNEFLGGNLTPLLVELVAGQYAIRGIGTTAASTATIGQAYLFGLVSGTDLISGPNFFFAWKDGSNGTDNLGVIDFDDASPTSSIVWLGANQTSFAVGNSFASQGTFSRAYSVQALVVPEPTSIVLLLIGTVFAVRPHRKRRKC